MVTSTPVALSATGGTIAAQRHELGQCHERLAMFQTAVQSIVTVWEQGDLAYAVRRLAALLPK